MSPEMSPGAFCLRNLKLDCPTTCPLYPEARRTIEQMADSLDKTIPETLELTRNMPQTKIDDTNRLNNGILFLSGVSERCSLKDEI
jgi:hypothetical protein